MCPRKAGERRDVMLEPIFRSYFGHSAGARPLVGGDTLRNAKPDLWFRILARFFTDGTKCHSLALNSKNPRLSPLAGSQPGTRLAGTLEGQ